MTSDPASALAVVAALQRLLTLLDGLGRAEGLGGAWSGAWAGVGATAAGRDAAAVQRASVGVRDALAGAVPALRVWAEELAAAVRASPDRLGLAGPAPVAGPLPSGERAAAVLAAAGESAAAPVRALPVALPAPRAAGSSPLWTDLRVAGAALARRLGPGLESTLRAEDDPQVLERLRAARGSPSTVHVLVAALGPGRLAQLAATAPDLLGSLDGVPWGTRVAANRAALTAAEADARAAGDLARADVLARLLADPSRQLLLVDPAGDGRVVELHGDLARADRVAVLVPGVTSTLAVHDERLAPRAERLAAAAAALDGGRTVVVSWLGYDAPGVLDAPLTRAAAVAGPALAAFVGGPGVGPDGRRRRTVLVGHSYGSLVAAEAVRAGARPDALALLGSPGVGAGGVPALGLPPGSVFAARAPGDAVGWTEAFGGDPAGPRSGAVRLGTGSARGHAAYLDAGDTALPGVAAVVVGRPGLAATVEPDVVERVVAVVDEAQRRQRDATVDALQRGAHAAAGDVEEAVPVLADVHELVDRAVDLTQRLRSLDLPRDLLDDAWHVLVPRAGSGPAQDLPAQASETPSAVSSTATDGSGSCAGPSTTDPSAGSNTEPWHGQRSASSR